MFKSVMHNGIYFTDMHNMNLKDMFYLREHGFPKDFSNHKDVKYLYVYPLVKNGRFSACFTMASANNIEDMFIFADFLKEREEFCLRFSEENHVDVYPKYATTAYKRGYRLGDTVWVMENPDYPVKHEENQK